MANINPCTLPNPHNMQVFKPHEKHTNLLVICDAHCLARRLNEMHELELMLILLVENMRTLCFVLVMIKASSRVDSNLLFALITSCVGTIRFHVILPMFGNSYLLIL